MRGTKIWAGSRTKVQKKKEEHQDNARRSWIDPMTSLKTKRPQNEKRRDQTEESFGIHEDGNSRTAERVTLPSVEQRPTRVSLFSQCVFSCLLWDWYIAQRCRHRWSQARVQWRTTRVGIGVRVHHPPPAYICLCPSNPLQSHQNFLSLCNPHCSCCSKVAKRNCRVSNHCAHLCCHFPFATTSVHCNLYRAFELCSCITPPCSSFLISLP